MGDLVENGKNKLEVRCKHCESVVLKPQAADYIEQQVRNTRDWAAVHWN